MRNEERTFVFWTYVSAHAQSAEIQQAAERMAREELGHVAKLRRERKHAFPSERAGRINVGEANLPALESCLALRLRSMAESAFAQRDNDDLLSLSYQSELRAKSLHDGAFEGPIAMASSTAAAFDKALPLSEHLVDCYLGIGENVDNERDTARASAFAAEIIHCLRALRSLPGA